MNRTDWLKIACFAAVLALAFVIIGRIDTTQAREETGMVRDAVVNAALTCYAVEGAYPDELEYLRKYYQLAYDEDRYFVTYDYVGANIMPDIYVTEAETD
ncbi:MAG: hypothetical protein IKR85_02025 [Clostridia bacterium]|nr:hypothetical protein [Clostridia bacterium]